MGCSSMGQSRFLRVPSEALQKLARKAFGGGAERHIGERTQIHRARRNGKVGFQLADRSCGKLFADAEGKQELTPDDVILPMLVSTADLPQTGDTSNLALWTALLFISGGAAIGTTVVSRKKKVNR